jgi:predicted glycosyltransferase
MDFRPALLWAYGNGIPCFYGLRDILDHPDRIRAEWLDVLPSIARYFRKVLVYGQRDLFDVSQYGLPPKQTEYCGYVSDEAGRHGSQGILCTVGAGDSNLANHVLKVFSDCAFPEHKTLISGPHSTFPLEGRSGQDNIRYCPHMDPLWSSHRAVVCLGGYNTLIEALAYGLHIICVPRMEPRLEQSVRAQLFAERGWIHCIHPEGLSVGALQKAAYQPLHPRDGPILNGAEMAARTIAHEAGLHS